MSNVHDTQQDEIKVIGERGAKLTAIRAEGDPYPNDLRREHTSAQLQQANEQKTKEELEALDHKVSVAGRIMAKRGPLRVQQDASGTIQLYADKNTQNIIKDTWDQWDNGDIVGAKGAQQRAGRGHPHVHQAHDTALHQIQ